MSDMTPDEIEFFRTGELPTGLQEEAAAPAVNPVLDATITMNRTDDVVAEPIVALAEPVVVPPAAPAAPAVDLASLQRQIEESNRIIEQMRVQLSTPPPAPAAAPETPIDASLDPLGHIIQQNVKLNQIVVDLQAKQSKRDETTQQQAQMNEFTNQVRSAKETFEKTAPDFSDAYNHIRTLRTEDLRLAGCPEADIAKILLQDEFQLAQVALQRGKNPAEEMYNMAKRYGYAAKAAAPGVPAAPVVGAAAKLAALQAGQAAARNIQAAAPAAAAPTLATLRESSSNDLNNLVQNDDMWARIVGGKSGNDIF